MESNRSTGQHARGYHPIRVLLIEGSEADAELIRKTLWSTTIVTSEPIHYALDHEARFEEGLRRCAAERYDVVLLDLTLPGPVALARVKAAVERLRNVPILILTGRDDDEMAHQSLRLGAQDYLIKNELINGSLRRTIRYTIERHRMAAELERSRREQLATKDEFLSLVSHELKTPLTAIFQFVSILLDGLGGELTPDQRSYLKIVHRNADQLRSMIGDLMEVARSETGKLAIRAEPIDVQTALEQSISSIRAEAARVKVHLDLVCAARLPEVYADPARVQQILANLLGNAIKFTPEAGRVRVLARRRGSDRVQIGVHDSGPGIPEASRERVFERLHQENEGRDSRGGLGLGLYIARQLVERHGGRIWVDEAPSGGCAFEFTLPVYALDRIIAAVAGGGEALFPSFSLIRVELEPEERSGVPLSEYVRAATHERLARIVYYDVDRVLPRAGGTGAGETFWIAARTDAAGAAAMRARIAWLLSQNDELEKCRIRTSAIEISVPGPESGLDEARRLARAVTDVQAVLRTRPTAT